MLLMPHHHGLTSFRTLAALGAVEKWDTRIFEPYGAYLHQTRRKGFIVHIAYTSTRTAIESRCPTRSMNCHPETRI